MKTLLIFILSLFLSFFCHGQSAPSGALLSIATHGNLLLDKWMVDSAITYSSQFLHKKKIDLLDRGQAYYVFGKAQYLAGDLDKAEISLQNALDIATKLKKERLILWIFNSLACVAGDRWDPDLDLSARYLAKAEMLAQKLQDTVTLAKVYLNASNLFYNLEDYTKAISYNYRCDTLLKNTTFYPEKAANLYGRGRNLIELYNTDPKKTYLDIALLDFEHTKYLYDSLGNKVLSAQASIAIGSCLLYLDRLPEAEKHLEKSIKLGLETGNDDVLLNGFYAQTSLYEMQENYVAAVGALDSLIKQLEKMGKLADPTFIKEQFANSDTRVSVAFINAKIENFQKKIEQRKLEVDKQKAEAKSQALVLGLLISALFLLLLGIIILHIRHKHKLTKEKLENTLKTQEIDFMRARAEGEEASRHRIARQIHDGVGGLLVSTKWNLESALEELSKKETGVATRLNENLRLQEYSYQELRRVVHALEQEETAWWDDLQQIYAQTTQQGRTKIQFYTHNLDQNVRGTIGKDARLIVQELITNALKHAKATEIIVQINQIDLTLGIIVEDNGIGMDIEGKTEKGMGLRSLEERCAKLRASLLIDSEKGLGTTIFIDIPIDNQSFMTENPLLYAGTN